MNGKAVIKNILFTESVVVIMLNYESASHCWEKISSTISFVLNRVL